MGHVRPEDIAMEIALGRGHAHGYDGHLYIPDVAVAEMIANGEVVPDGTVRSWGGRSVLVVRVEDEGGQG